MPEGIAGKDTILEDGWFGPEHMTEEYAPSHQLYLSNLFPNADTDQLVDRLREGDQLIGRVIVDATLELAYTEFDGAIDRVTGLKRREQYEKWLDSVYGFGLKNERAPQDNVKHPRTLTVLLTDVNNFKKINDKLGPPVGDSVLRQAAEEMVEELRVGDRSIAVRESGDENRVAIADLSAEEAHGMWRRMFRDQLEKSDDHRLQTIWEKIDEAIAGCPDPKNYYHLVEVRVDSSRSFEDIIVEKRILYINGQRIAPIKELVVVDLGYAHGEVTSKEMITKIDHRALAHRKKVKERSHDRVGGAYRDTSTPMLED